MIHGRIVIAGVDAWVPAGHEWAPWPGEIWKIDRAATTEAALAAAGSDCDGLIVTGPNAAEWVRAAAVWPAVAVVIVGPDDAGGGPRFSRATSAEELALDLEAARIVAHVEKLRDLGGDEFVAEVVELFLEQTPRQIEEMKRSVAAGEIAAARKTAHTLKSAAANFAARAVQGLALEIERGPDADAELVGQLEEAFARTAVILRQPARIAG